MPNYTRQDTTSPPYLMSCLNVEWKQKLFFSRKETIAKKETADSNQLNYVWLDLFFPNQSKFKYSREGENLGME